MHLKSPTWVKTGLLLSKPPKKNSSPSAERPAASTGLMALPTEIRQMIWHMIAREDCAEAPRAQSLSSKYKRWPTWAADEPHSDDNRTYRPLQYPKSSTSDEEYPERRQRPGIWKQELYYRPLQNDVLTLRLVNHKTKNEIDYILGNSKNCEADVTFVQNAGLWMTWLGLPGLSRDISQLRLQFRIFNFSSSRFPVESMEPQMWPRRFWEPEMRDFQPFPDIGPGARLFSGFLEGLLHGAAGPWPACVQHRTRKGSPQDEMKRSSQGCCRCEWRSGLTVKHLVYDIISTGDGTPPGRCFERPLPAGTDRCKGNMEDPVSVLVSSLPQEAYAGVPPTKLAAFGLAKYLHRELSKMEDVTSEYFGGLRIMFERVGTIDIRVNGERFQALDLDDMFACLPLHLDPKFVDAKEFWHWHKRAKERRKALGFHVARNSKKRPFWRRGSHGTDGGLDTASSR